MKHLIQYAYKVNTLFHGYYVGSLSREGLLLGLKEVEDHARKHSFDKDKECMGLWFRFFEGDTAATTINNLENDLFLPTQHNNREYIEEMIETIVKKGGIQIYFS